MFIFGATQMNGLWPILRAFYYKVLLKFYLSLTVILFTFTLLLHVKDNVRQVD